MPLMNEMSKDVCLALAQIMPVLLVVLIAEQVTVRITRTGRVHPRDFIAASARIVVDFALALALVVETWAVLRGIQSDGLVGDKAGFAWNLALFLLIAVVYRWLLLTPFVRFAITRVFNLYLRVTQDLIARLTAAVSVLPLGIARMTQAIAVVLSFLVEFIGHVLTGGIFAFSEKVTRAIINRAAKNPEDDDSTDV